MRATDFQRSMLQCIRNAGPNRNRRWNSPALQALNQYVLSSRVNPAALGAYPYHIRREASSDPDNRGSYRSPRVLRAATISLASRSTAQR